MAWTARKRAGRSPQSFDSHGDYRGGIFTNFVVPVKKLEPSEDAKNRGNVVKKIEEAIEAGRKLEDIVSELAENEEICKQFDYLTRNGLDLQKIFTSWYQGNLKNKSRNNNIAFGRDK